MINFTNTDGVNKEVIEVVESIDYTVFCDNVIYLFLIIVFLLGIVCGLVFAKIMWGRIHV